MAETPLTPRESHPPQRRGRGLLAVLVVLVLLAVGAGRAIVVRASNAKALNAESATLATQYVQTAVAKPGAATQALALPGTLQGYVQAPISARASGYVKRWYKDIGARVKEGELLADIETPEIDQQLTQAIAARAQLAASLELAKSSASRWEALRKRDAVSQQELDERRSADAQARANLAAADANVARLRQLKAYNRVTAPFAGVITRRNIDVGDLIDAAGGSAGRPLFLLSQTDPLRVYVNVPQAFANLVSVDMPVKVTQSELKGRTFPGKVARTSESIDPTTRTMQIEVQLPNQDGALLPGAFVQVRLDSKSGDSLVIPSNALLFRPEGVRVGVVDAQGVVKLRPVQVGRNLGETIEVVSGLTTNDRFVVNPSDSLADGDKVQVQQPAAGGKPADAAAPEKGAPGKPA